MAKPGDQIEFLVRTRCETCDGEGSVPATPVPGAVLAPGSQTSMCRDCEGSGELRTWLPLSDVRAQLIDV